MSPIIDIHCHLAGINPNFETIKSLGVNKIQNKALAFFCNAMGVNYHKDIPMINEQIKVNLVRLIEDSILTHAVILPMDGIYDEAGNRKEKDSVFYVPNSTVFEFAKKSNKLIPACSINPQRKDAFEQLDLAIKNNAALLKLLQGMQMFDPANPKYTKFFTKVAENNIPVLMHIGAEASLVGTKLKKEYHKLQKVIPLLEAGCTVIAAHGCGFSLFRDKKVFNGVVELINRYPNLYLDNSALPSFHRGKRAINMLKFSEAIDKTVYGSDYPVKTYPYPFSKKLGVKHVNEIRKIPNPINKDIEIKKQLGFPEETFSKGYKLINPNSLKDSLN